MSLRFTLESAFSTRFCCSRGGFGSLALGDDGGKRQTRHRQHRKQHVEERRIDERRVGGKRAGAERREDRRQRGDQEHAEGGAAEPEIDRTPHHEREHGKRQHMKANRNEWQVAEDHEACTGEKDHQRAKLDTARLVTGAQQAWQREDQRCDQKDASAVA